MNRRSVPDSKRCVANECLSVWTEACFEILDLLRAGANTFYDKPSGIAPYGFRWTEIRSAARREKIVQADPTEEPVVTELFRDYLRVGSVGKLCRDLEEHGILNRRGKTFSRQAMYGMLTNDFYTGTVRHGKVNRDGNHDALVNSITFGKVQAAVNRNRRR
jgi:site-specific DNA recombinase